MSCIANFYLDGVKYCLEDKDMDLKSTHRLLQKVIEITKGNQVSESIVKSDESSALDHGDMLNQMDRQTEQQLNECDDEEMLKDL